MLVKRDNVEHLIIRGVSGVRHAAADPPHPRINVLNQLISLAPSVPPRRHTEAMQLHLVPGSAGCPRRANHRLRWKYNTGKLISPPNITLLPLAPGAPELNSVETIWQFIRDSYLSSSIFGSYDEIVALCCEIWNKRIDQPWRIMSIGCRKSAYGF